MNVAVNREELLRDIKGYGVIIPALLPREALGYDPTLTPYAPIPARRDSSSEAGYSDGLMLALIAPEALQMRAITVSMMLEQAGFMVDLQILEAAAFSRQTRVSGMNHPPEQQTWDIALQSALDPLNFPPLFAVPRFRARRSI